MPERYPRQHRSVIVGLRAQQEDGAIGRPPLLKRLELEFSFLDPVDLDPISATGFQFRFVDVHHRDIPARSCQSTTEDDSNASGPDDVHILHPYEYLAASKPQALFPRCHRKKRNV